MVFLPTAAGSMDTTRQTGKRKNVIRELRRALKSSDEGEEREILARFAARVKKPSVTTSCAAVVKVCRVEESV